MDYIAYDPSFLARESTGIALGLFGALAVVLAVVFIDAKKRAARVALWLSISLILLSGFGAFGVQMVGDSEELDLIEARSAQIEETYGYVLTLDQIHSLKYPVSQPTTPAVYGIIQVPVSNGSELEVMPMSLAWNGEELLLLGSPGGSPMEELPRVDGE